MNAVVTPAMRAGLRVTIKATRGKATLKSPSARLDKLDEVQRRQNPAPNDSGSAVGEVVSIPPAWQGRLGKANRYEEFLSIGEG